MSIPATNLVTTPSGVSTVTLAPMAAPVANLLNTVCVFLRHVTRGATAYYGFVLQGIRGSGNIFAHAAQFGGIIPASLTFTIPPVGSVIPQGSTLLTKRSSLVHGTRTGYGALGCPTMVIYNAMLPSPVPDALVVNAVLMADTMRGSKVTSAVVAAGNVAIATATGKAVVVPSAVAAVAAVQVGKLVAASKPAAPPAAPPAARPANMGKTAAERKLHGKH